MWTWTPHTSDILAAMSPMPFGCESYVDPPNGNGSRTIENVTNAFRL